MTDKNLLEIIDACLALDRRAQSIYSGLARTFAGLDAGLFWADMAREEEAHVAFWEALAAFAHAGYLPQMFEEPQGILEGLARNAAEIARLDALCEQCADVNMAFIIAYRLEFALLHPAFETLFRFAHDSELPLGLENPEQEYNGHIQRFVEALSRFGRITPELELIGELLQRVWQETKTYVAQVHTDALTGILNRRGFFKVIEPLVFLTVRNLQPAGLLMVDIDFFKAVNDAHGHQAGDLVLISVAKAIKRALRRSDVAGRYGGEEFIVFLPGCARADLKRVGEKVREEVEGALHNNIQVTVSVGASHLPRVASAGEIERLITQADLCLYAAKREGRNRLIVECTGIVA